MKYLICFAFLIIGCGHLQTHQEILDQGGGLGDDDLIEPQMVLKKTSSPPLSSKEIDRLKERLDFLERNTIQRGEFDSFVEKLNQQIQDLSGQQVSSKNSQTLKPSKDQDLLVQADKYFKDKNYKQAIFAYEKVRKTNPPPQIFKTATMNIGHSFVQLGLKKESQVFFKEIIERFPGSKEAKEAQALLSKEKSISTPQKI